jgi:replication factor A1
VIDIEAREVQVKGEPKMVYSGILADPTGKVQFSAWYDFNIKVDDVVKISPCYVKNWKSIPQLSFDENSTVELLDDDEIPGIDELDQGPVRKIIDFEELGGGYDVVIEGVILEIRPGSGIIKRCPQCRRVLQDDNCSVHGQQTDGLIDLRVKAIIDDGTASIMGVLSGDLTSKILGIPADEYREKAFSPGYSEMVLDKLNENMLIERFKFRGNVTQDNR